MDGFWAFCLWTALTCSGAYAAGNLLSTGQLTRDCATVGEIKVGDTIIKCEITHKIIGGRRTALEKPE
jgi:hypothetical protein